MSTQNLAPLVAIAMGISVVGLSGVLAYVTRQGRAVARYGGRLSG
jgi:hypothetical protein